MTGNRPSSITPFVVANYISTFKSPSGLSKDTPMTVIAIAILILQIASLVLHAAKAPAGVDEVVDGVLKALEGKQSPPAPPAA